MTNPSGELIGFYAVNAHVVDYADLPEWFARNRPGHGRIPAAYISMIGVDRRFQGKGFGGDLLIDRFVRLAGASEALGIAIIMLDCGVPDQVERQRALYLDYGFEPLPSNALRLFMPMATMRRLLST